MSRDSRKMVDDLFGETYPKKREHRPEDSTITTGISEYNRMKPRVMEIHVMRSHFYDLLIVGANTGRKTMPKIYTDGSSWLSHAFPQCEVPGGWTTRSSKGDHGLGEPSLLVALFYRAGEDSHFDDTPVITGAWALVVHRHHGRIIKETFMEAPFPNECVLADDGLEAIHHILVDMMDNREPGTASRLTPWVRKLEHLPEHSVPRDIITALRKGIDHVTFAFRQGPIVPRRR